MWSDTESDKDYLNFGEVSNLAVGILNSPDMLPISMGVFGDWGAGKSSLLKLLESELKAENDQWITINFDAWMYQGYDDSRAALLEVIATEIQETVKDNESLSKKTSNLVARVDGFRALGLAAEGAALFAGIPTGGTIAKLIASLKNTSDGIDDNNEYEDIINNLKRMGKDVNGLIKDKPKTSPPKQIDEFRKEYSSILNELGRPIVVIIDNLDRCLPENAIHTLEAIRLFLFLPNTAFVIAADEDMIRSSVEKYFTGASERHKIDYIDKLIQVPIRVPKAGIREIRSYLFMLYAIDYCLSGEKLDLLRAGLQKSLKHSWKNDPISIDDTLSLTNNHNDNKLRTLYERADRIAPVLATSPRIQGNPRTIKRLLNVIKMRLRIAEKSEIPLDESIITKLVIFERCMGESATQSFYQIIDKEKGKPEIIKHLEELAEENAFPEKAPEKWEDSKLFLTEWAQQEPKLSDIDLRPAIYLSRETMSIGIYSAGLSPKAREILEVLVTLKSMSSPAGKRAIEQLSADEALMIMENMIKHLRQLSDDWKNKPTGFMGAVLLAEEFPDAAQLFSRFIDNYIRGEKRSNWLNTLLKKSNWYLTEDR